jgi:hypothetical protein
MVRQCSAGPLQRDTGKQGGAIGKFVGSNSLSRSCKPRDVTRFIGRRTYDANMVLMRLALTLSRRVRRKKVGWKGSRESSK